MLEWTRKRERVLQVEEAGLKALAAGSRPSENWGQGQVELRSHMLYRLGAALREGEALLLVDSRLDERSCAKASGVTALLFNTGLVSGGQRDFLYGLLFPARHSPRLVLCSDKAELLTSRLLCSSALLLSMQLPPVSCARLLPGPGSSWNPALALAESVANPARALERTCTTRTQLEEESAQPEYARYLPQWLREKWNSSKEAVLAFLRTQLKAAIEAACAQCARNPRVAVPALCPLAGGADSPALLVPANLQSPDALEPDCALCLEPCEEGEGDAEGSSSRYRVRTIFSIDCARLFARRVQPVDQAWLQARPAVPGPAAAPVAAAAAPASASVASPQRNALEAPRNSPRRGVLQPLGDEEEMEEQKLEEGGELELRPHESQHQQPGLENPRAYMMPRMPMTTHAFAQFGVPTLVMSPLRPLLPGSAPAAPVPSIDMMEAMLPYASPRSSFSSPAVTPRHSAAAASAASAAPNPAQPLKPCRDGDRCLRRLKCWYWHSDEIKEHWRAEHQRVRKTRKCTRLDAHDEEDCDFFHSDNDRRCYFCEGLGHGQDSCPGFAGGSAVSEAERRVIYQHNAFLARMRKTKKCQETHPHDVNACPYYHSVEDQRCFHCQRNGHDQFSCPLRKPRASQVAAPVRGRADSQIAAA